MIDVGDKFPDFHLHNQNGEQVSSDDLIGSKTVVYFYPKDDTPGCTVEACDFRDLGGNIHGARVIGVSPDSPKSHLKFVNKFQLNFTLLADEEKQLASALGIWVEKTLYGKKYMGVERTTYLLDESNTVLKVWRKVNPSGHSNDIQDHLA